MLRTGNLILVSDYKLRSGQTKNKFLIILSDESEHPTILLSLTTSQQYLQQEDLKPGCIEKGAKHMFLFPANTEIGDNGFFFRKDTFILTINNIVETTEAGFLKKYPIEKIRKVCTLKDHWFFDLVYCIYKSQYLPVKYKPRLEKLLEMLGSD